MYKLKFATDEDQAEYLGEGPTLFAALAAVESKLIEVYGPEVSLDKTPGFVANFEDLVADLSEPGGEFRHWDFSAPEEAYTITRL